MSILNLQKDNDPFTRAPVLAPAATRGEVFTSSAENTFRNFNPFSKDILSFVPTQKTYAQYEEITGRSIWSDAGMQTPTELSKTGTQFTDELINERNKKLDDYILSLRQKDPDKFGGLKTNAEILGVIKEDAKEAALTADKKREGAPDGMLTTGASLAGGVVASFADPINVATLPLGAGAGRSILKAMLIEGTINAGVEVAEHSAIAEWQKELGNEYGLDELATNAGTAFLFGAGVTGLARGAGKVSKVEGLSHIREKLKDMGRREADGALQQLEVDAHIKENDLSGLPKKNDLPEIEFKRQQAALSEINAAWKEGRAINIDNIPVTHRDILDLDPAKVKDPIVAEKIKEFQEGVELPILERLEDTTNELQGEWNTVSQRIDELDERLVEATDPEIRAQLEENIQLLQNQREKLGLQIENNNQLVDAHKAGKVIESRPEPISSSERHSLETKFKTNEVELDQLQRQADYTPIEGTPLAKKIQKLEAEQARIRERLAAPKSLNDIKPIMDVEDFDELAFPNKGLISERDAANVVEATEARLKSEFSRDNIALIENDIQQFIKDNPDAKIKVGGSEYKMTELDAYFRDQEGGINVLKTCAVGG